MRDETRDLWQALEGLGTGDSNMRGMWISGPPGVGKSTEVYAWGMHHATRTDSERRNMLWVHESSKTCYEFVKVFEGSMTTTTTTASIDYENILGECGGCDILIFDAVKQQMMDLVVSAIQRFENAIIVACTSYQSGNMNQEQFFKFGCFNFDYTVYSWTWDQYKAAHEAGVFGEEVDLEVLREKFYYCGGCIRLMVRNVDIITSFLNKALNKVEDKRVLLEGVGGLSSAAAVNSLVSVRPSETATDITYVVSQFVSRQLSLIVDDSFLQKLQLVNTDNPAWQGWVFEFRLLYSMTKVKNTGEVYNLLSLDEASCPVLNVLVSFVLKYIRPGGDQPQLSENTFFIPERWNQGCFDAVYFHYNDGKRCFDFLNATIAESHVFKCQHMADFLQWAIGTPAARALPHSDVKVTLFAVTHFNNRNRFDLTKCEVMDHESVQNFDPSFNQQTLKLLHTGEFF